MKSSCYVSCKSEMMSSFYRLINDAWKYSNTMTAVNFCDQFQDWFVPPGKSKEPLHHAMVVVAEPRSTDPQPEVRMAAIRKVKLVGPEVNPALHPEAPATALQLIILSSTIGQMLKATEKLIELQTQALQCQSSRKENAQPNKSNQQGHHQSSGTKAHASVRYRNISLPGKPHHPRDPRRASCGLFSRRGGSSLEDDSSDDQPEYVYLG